MLLRNDLLISGKKCLVSEIIIYYTIFFIFWRQFPEKIIKFSVFYHIFPEIIELFGIYVKYFIDKYYFFIKRYCQNQKNRVK